MAKFVEHVNNKNKGGWGLANMDGNDAYIYREPVSAQQSLLAHFLTENGINGNTNFPHIRHSTVGDINLANTHPFNHEWQGQNHLFLFNGDIPDVIHAFGCKLAELDPCNFFMQLIVGYMLSPVVADTLMEKGSQGYGDCLDNARRLTQVCGTKNSVATRYRY